MALEGIDVSVWQHTPDWKAAAPAIAFGYARAIYGTSQDTTFKADWKSMKAAGIPRGAYDFQLPSIGGALQARTTLGVLNGDLGELPVTIDVETLPKGMTPQQIADDAQAWVEEIQRQAPLRRVMIYGSPGVLNTLPLAWVAAKGVLLWTAHYNVPAPMSCKWWPGGYTLWQYGTRTVPGFANPVDADRFQGTLSELTGLVGTGDRILVPDAVDVHPGSEPIAPSGKKA